MASAFKPLESLRDAVGRGMLFPALRLMRATVSAHLEVKAAGGIRTLDQMLDMLAAGATRFGSTATATIIDELALRG